MRAYSWSFLTALAMACSGSAFSTQGGESGSGSGNESGSSSRAGSLGRGGLSGKGGKGNGGSVAVAGNANSSGTDGNGGVIGIGGSIGVAGDVTFGGTQGVAGDPSGGGTGPDPIDTMCPVELPNANRACEPGLNCTYGSHLLASCRSRAQCVDGGWVIELTSCPDLHGCNNIVGGSPCNPEVSPPCTLGNDNDIYCVCTGCSSAGPCTDNTVWKCAAGSGGAGCPKVLPNQGQKCVVDRQCPYGSCATGESMSASCDGTTWKWESLQCPQ